MIQRFKKLPIEIYAVQFDGSNFKEIEDFIGYSPRTKCVNPFAVLMANYIEITPIFHILIETKEGLMEAAVSDWIIKEPYPTGDRDFYPCKDEIFKKTYIPITF